LYDFSPFFKTCEEKGIKPIQLRKDKVVSGEVLAKMGRNEHVELRTIAKICKYLEVPIEKVVRIKYNE
jgi:DNA-binding Xre family transcriptional regulator